MTFLGFLKQKIVLGALGALVVVGVAAGVTANAAHVLPTSLVAAQPSPSPGAGQKYCQDFLNHLAGDLGVSDDKLHSAGVQAADQTIDDAVAAGKLTADQAAKLKQRIASAPACAFGGRFGPGFGRDRDGAGMFGVTGAMLQAAAQTLHLTPQQLKTDLMQGKTLSSLAGGMSEAQFRTSFLANLKTILDQQVKAGKLTQDRENQLLQRLQTAPIPFWDHSFMPRHGAAPAQSPAPGTGA